MRSIKLDKWKSKVPKYGEDGKSIVGSEEVEEDLLSAINALLASKKPEDMPRGLDNFRLFGRLSKAFKKADESRVLKLEEVDYSFLKKMIETDTPAAWGMNENILKAVEEFLNSEESK